MMASAPDPADSLNDFLKCYLVKICMNLLMMNMMHLQEKARD